MAAISWLSKLIGSTKESPSTGATTAAPPALHPMVERVAEVLRGDYSRSEYRQLAERLEAMLSRAGGARSLADRTLVAAFAVTGRHALAHAPDPEWRDDVAYWFEIVPRYAGGGAADPVDVVAAGSSVLMTVQDAEQRGAAASAALRKAVDGGDIPPDVAQAFDDANRRVRAAKGVMQSLAVLGYVRRVSAEWAAPNAEALERLFGLAGENAAHQVLSVDRALGLTLLEELLAACHGS